MLIRRKVFNDTINLLDIPLELFLYFKYDVACLLVHLGWKPSNRPSPPLLDLGSLVLTMPIFYGIGLSCELKS